MSKFPTISIVMPFYNGEKYLKEAIESILKQTFTDFELILINDGSTDASEEIAGGFSDKRIVYLDNGKNLGLAASFNTGIDYARGAYIARMDADDVSLPDRFERQFSYLEKKSHIGIIGSGIILINELGEKIATHKRPKTHVEIKFGSLFSSPMYHPTIMGRTGIFKSHHYSETFSNSEDYELWSRLLFQTDVKFANLARPVLKYRVYPQSFTQSLNLDRRALSAHNTVRNVSHYIELSQGEKDFIIHLRQERALTLPEFITGLILYLRTTFIFLNKEQPGTRETLGIWKKYLQFVLWLFKYQIRKALKI
jgi:glycosyltransferase involved in cell wall biosynthesis